MKQPTGSLTPVLILLLTAAGLSQLNSGRFPGILDGDVVAMCGILCLCTAAAQLLTCLVFSPVLIEGGHFQQCLLSIAKTSKPFAGQSAPAMRC